MENIYLRLLVALLVAFAVAFVTTPFIRALAFRIGAVDVPKDNRRMHNKPMPLIGGVGIFIGFTISCAIFYSIYCGIDRHALTVWFGGLLIIALGIIDDVVSLNPWVKLCGQILAAIVTVSQHIVIDYINIGGLEFHLGIFAYPLTVLWIVALTNAINLIDGLDGLACGVSAISSVSILIVAILHANFQVSLLTAILVGACLGFLPFNANPAKIFMGDTGAMFLGYTLSVISILGVFKSQAAISILIPIIIFGLPIFDTSFAFLRRLSHGRSPFSADRGHLHHRLVDSGFNQKQSVLILYAVCSVLGLLGILLAENKFLAFIIILCVSVAIGLLNLLIVRRHNKELAQENETNVEKATSSESDNEQNK